MAVTKEEVQIAVQINGEKSGKTLKDMRSDVKQLRSELEQLPAGSEAYNKKLGELQGKQKVLDDHNKAIKNVSGGLKGMLNDFGPVGKSLSGMIDGFEGLATKGKGVISGLGGVRSAMIAIPLIAIIAAISSLVAYFKRTDEGAEKLAGIMRGLEAVVTVLVGRLLNLGSALGDILSGNFNAGFEKMGKTFDNLGTDIANAAVAGYDLELALAALEDQQRDTNLETAKNEALISRLLLQSKDRTKSEQERLALLDQASAIEKTNFDNEVKYADQKLKLAQQEAAFAERNGQITDELRDKVNEAQIERIKLEQGSIDLQEKISNRRNALIEKEAETRAKDLAQKLKEEEQRAKAIEKTLQDARKFEQEYVDFRNQLIADSFDQERAVRMTEYDRQRTALEEKGLLDAELIKAMDEQLATDLAEIEIARSEEKLSVKIGQLDEANALEKAKQEELVLLKKQSDGEYSDSVLAINLETIEKKMEALEAAGKRETAQYQQLKNEALKTNNEITASKLSSLKAQNDAAVSAANGYLQQASQVTSGILQLTKVEADEKVKAAQDTAESEKKSLKNRFDQGLIDKTTFDRETLAADARVKAVKNQELTKQFVAEKAIKVGQTVAAGALAIIQALAQLGPVAGPVAAGIVGGVTAVQLAVIAAQAPPTFAKGGIVNGSKHGSKYGDAGIALIDRITGSEVGEMEGGEPILTSGVTRNPVLLAAASRINVLGGGRPFYEDGGVVPTPTTSTTSGNNDQLIAEVRAMREEMATYQSNLKVALVYSDFEDFSKKVAIVSA